jgi:hypothetical protein
MRIIQYDTTNDALLNEVKYFLKPNTIKINTAKKMHV